MTTMPQSDAYPRTQWQVPTYETTVLRPRRSSCCVVIPVLNEGERIRRLLKRMLALDLPDRCDVIVVDGGSTDGSLELAFLAAQGVGVLLRKTGPGRLGAQLRCAYAFALDRGYAGVITIDGNDKDDPDAIPAFADALEGGADFVQGSRFVRGGVAENTPASRLLAIRLLHAPVLSLAAGVRWTDTTQGFRAYSAALLRDPRLAIFRDVFDRYELLAYLSARAPRLGYRCVELPTARRYPQDGSVPTKISGLRGNLDLLATLFKASTGAYDPPAPGA
jgi:glycosyltransferase involved in cell wall biosynthesis